MATPHCPDPRRSIRFVYWFSDRWDRIQLTDWSGDGKSIGFFATKVFWEYWVVENLLAGGRQEIRREN